MDESCDSTLFRRPVREQKGKSLIMLPSTYCVVDIETTGLDPTFDSIIEIGAVKYINGEETSSFSSLLKPDNKRLIVALDKWVYIDPFIEELTGITNEMLEQAPETKSVLDAFFEFLKGDLIIGYNVNFDVNFLYDNSMRYFKRPMINDFVDVMRIARKLYPDMEHHRLSDMTALFNIQNESAHRAVADCIATNALYQKLRQKALIKNGSEDAFIALYKRPSHHHTVASDIIGNIEANNPDNPLYGKYCVFTGKLDRMPRKEAMQIVADIGGFNEDGVTKKTNYLILGNNDYCSTIKDGKSSKHKKAEKLQLKGQDIAIIPEDVFYDMLES